MKSTQESVEDLMEILSPAAKNIITDEQVKQAQAAAASGDKHLAGKVLGDIWKQVAEKSAGLGLERLDSDAFGKKIGWLTSQQRSEKTVRDFLAKYKRELAIQPMQEATNNLFAIDSTTEVVRESVGETCQWCLNLCGIWHPYDANHYGVWTRHAGCDCKIYVRNSLT